MSDTAANFIEEIVREDNATGKWEGRVHTRFPPEPNGYLHIGHAKSILLNYGLAEKFGGKFNLRFDDTNPAREEQEYVDAIIEDVRWLGADWQGRLFFASDYFERMYACAEQLVKAGKAYVDDQDDERIKATRGTVRLPGLDSPYRERTPEENLDLLRRMRAGEFADGEKVLRARIDMAAPNMLMRDPLIYRIRHATHHRTGDDWCIYPMYDWAHGLEDSIEGITHSICTLEFEVHRPLYDWFLDQLGAYHPQQIEFARLNLTHTLMSKRKLLRLVDEGVVDGWDDPRLPTVSGLRRRGYTPASIRDFCDRIGVARASSTVDIQLLEHCLREELNLTTRRVMAVLDPLKVVITNYPEGKAEDFDCVNNPENEADGTRPIPFTRELWIERSDFMEDPPRKFFRLAPGREVRLKHAYYVTCDEAVKDADGNVVELRCTYDPASRGGATPDGRKVRGTLHWVSAAHALDAEVRLYDHLFGDPFPGADENADPADSLNPESLVVRRGCKLEPGLAPAEPGYRCQFMRHGYFCVDSRDSRPGVPVFNRTVSLKDSWAKQQSRA
ncbi:glutamine--tRNA ligase/YqeY domain fusion protein [bacterium]|nr:glutamine--tRNA ligase/YqeY domain fusion protein [bacterium]MBU1072215.1 glutamine--tRNA ligase/YqeY domain fusion protein [bacterium]MBU1674838.1 glutamine--tRNA ligase/YqeY domain fusion protein [bacterium]